MTRLRVFPASLALISAALLAAGAGCTDFATPAELQKPTVLAIVADPPITPPGAQSRLDLVVVDATGRVPTADATWTMVETFLGVPPLGTVASNGDGTATYTAPTDPPPVGEGEPPPLDSVRVDIPSMPRPLSSLKGMLIADVPSANPTMATVTVDGNDSLSGAAARAGQKSALAVTIDPPAGEDAAFAWYSTLGEIEDYQSAEATLVAPETAGSGWLFVVVRDGTGGVVWHGSPLTVE